MRDCGIIYLYICINVRGVRMKWLVSMHLPITESCSKRTRHCGTLSSGRQKCVELVNKIHRQGGVRSIVKGPSIVSM